MQRVFINHPALLNSQDPEQAIGQEVCVRGDIQHYLARVLRLRPGDGFVAVPDLVASGGQVDRHVHPSGIAAAPPEYIVRIDQLEGSSLCGRIVEIRRPRVEPRIRVTTAQGLIKGDGFELVIQKTTELGGFDVVPLELARCDVRLSRARAAKKVERWQKIAREAAEQSQRTHQPVVRPVTDLESFLEGLQRAPGSGELRLLPYEGERETGVWSVLQHGDQLERVIILTGPEGGLEPQEVELASEWGFTPVSLGPRILRAETAAIATAAMVLYTLDDLGHHRLDE